jgi:hypothetical protein
MMMRLAFVFLLAAAAHGFVVSRPTTRTPTPLGESFGFDFAEDSYENTPAIIRGEANYKQWVNRIDSDSFLNRQVSLIVVVVVWFGVFAHNPAFHVFQHTLLLHFTVSCPSSCP